MVRFVSWFVAICLALVAIGLMLPQTSVQAVSENDLTFTLNSDGESYHISGCSSSAGDTLEIPSTYMDKPVTGIGKNAFQGCSNLTSITIPDSITSIGDYAFSRCTGLTRITIPDGVTSIGSSAFYGCISLTDITIPDGVTSIGEFAFYGCTGLTSLTIPDGVASIGNNMFYECSNLTSITIPDSITSIGDYAFSRCTSLTRITIPDGVTSIGSNAFYGCISLTGITIPEGVTSIGSNVFHGCTSLTDIIIPDSVTSIWDYAFYECTSLTDITIPDGVINIDSHVFHGCTSLTDITIPDSITSIGDSAFYECTSLTDITIPDGVTSIGSNVFYGCTSLTDITIPDSVTYVSYRAFQYCSNLTSITILDSVTSIASNAFSDCAIKRLVVADGSKTITREMVMCQSTLQEVVIPDSVTSIGDGAFMNCSNITDVYYGGTIQQWLALGNNTPRAARIHYSCHPAEVQWETVTTEPTCTKDGYTTHTCNCGITYTTDPVDKLDHNMGEWTVIKEPACTAEGSKRRDCDRCDHFETEVINATGHDYKSVVTAPTCTAKGYTTHTCSVCSNSYADSETAAQGHSYKSVVTAPTCTTAGYTTYSCSCGDTYTSDPVDKLGHNMGSWTVVQEPTCTCNGLKQQNCSRCDYSINDGIAAEGHDHKAVVTAPTCTNNGYTTHTCSVCGNSYADSETAALGHAMGEWTVITEATPSAKGEEKQTCSRCDYAETRELEYEGNVVSVSVKDLLNPNSVWINGAECPVTRDGDTCYITLPEGKLTNMVSYSYNDDNPKDIHTQYPTGMRVWRLTQNADGTYSATYVKELDNILQYAGSSIRITGTKGIRMITPVEKAKKSALTGNGLAGYKLVEYGTALCWAKDLEGGKPMTLGNAYVKSNYAYKRGVADPIFAQTDTVVQYTNVLVGFDLDQCKHDIAMRPYIVLEDEKGEQITIYGGIVYRSIGYIAYQNRNAFQPGNASYDYVWEIIHHVYGKEYDADFRH